MLGRSTTVRDSLRRVTKFVAVIFVISLILMITKKTVSPDYEISKALFVREVLKGNLPNAGAYWFLYAYIGYLLMLPFLQKVAHEIKSSEINLLIGLHLFLFSLLPIINLFLLVKGMERIDISGHMSIPLVSVKALFYPLVGYYFDNKVCIEDLKGKKVAVLVMIGIVLSSMATKLEGTVTGTYTQNYVQLFEPLSSIGVFLFIKKVFINSKCKIVSKIGRLTFGMYLFDPVLRLFYPKYSTIMEPIFPTMIVSIIWVFSSMVIGGILTYILKKTTVVRKYI